MDAIDAVISALMREIAGTLPPAPPCMICRRRERSVTVAGGGEVCNRCAIDRPIEMLPEGWRR